MGVLRQGGEQEASSSLLGAWATRKLRAPGRGKAHLLMGPAALQTEASKQAPLTSCWTWAGQASGACPQDPPPPRSSGGTCSIQVCSVSSPEQRARALGAAASVSSPD